MKLRSVNVNCAVQAENEFWPVLICLISILIDKHEKAKSKLHSPPSSSLSFVSMPTFFSVKPSALLGSKSSLHQP